jgi:hypothetical protein
MACPHFPDFRPTSSLTQVLSLLEGKPTQLAGFMPTYHIVPPESANPGFGRVVLLPDADHIASCKPPSRADASYYTMIDFVRELMASHDKMQGQAAAEDPALWSAA